MGKHISKLDDQSLSRWQPDIFFARVLATASSDGSNQTPPKCHSSEF